MIVKANFRDQKGRFQPGNPGGPGAKIGGRVQALRMALIAAISPEDIAALAQALLRNALGGDLESTKILLRYAIGEPVRMEAPEVVEENDLERRGRLRRLRESDERDERLYGDG